MLRPTLIALVMLLTSFGNALAEVGVTDSEILIGQSTATTGPAVTHVKLHMTGEQLYFRKVNESGGINGRKVRVITLDDGYDPQKALANTEHLIRDEHVFALFKYYGTSSLKASFSLIEKSGTPLIGPTSGAEFLYARVYPNVFLMRPSFFTETEELVNYLVEKRGVKRVALLRPDDGYGSEGRNGVQKALNHHKLALVSEAVYRHATTDFNEAYRTIAEGKPEAIILWMLPKPAVDFFSMLKTKAYKGLTVGCTSMATPEFAEVGEGAIMSFSAPLVSENSPYAFVRQYMKDARAAGQEPHSTAFRGYFDAMILSEAMKRAGKDLTRESLRESFERKLGGTDFGGLKLNFSPTNHRGLNHVFLGQVKDGKFEMFKD